MDVESIERTVVSLPALTAVFPDGELRAIEAGSYLIERIAEGMIYFRESVANDLEGGEKPPAVMPPTLRTNARELFGADGEPLFVHVSAC